MEEKLNGEKKEVVETPKKIFYVIPEQVFNVLWTYLNELPRKMASNDICILIERNVNRVEAKEEEKEIIPETPEKVS